MVDLTTFISWTPIYQVLVIRLRIPFGHSLLIFVAGALATGAGSLKTVEERELFGGFPNAALDTCYHQV